VNYELTSAYFTRICSLVFINFDSVRHQQKSQLRSAWNF